MCRNLYLELLKKSLLDVIYEEETDAITNGTNWPKRAFTMIGRKRLENLQYCVEYVIQNNIDGDLIETGVWRGGAVIFMQGIVKSYKSNKKVFVADSFNGVPSPSIQIDQNSNLHNVALLRVSVEQVKSNFRKYELLDDNVIFLEGLFKNTLKTDLINKISVLRLDGDLYESTKDSLENLYHKVTIGGFIIIDDWAWINCKTAVDEFRDKNNIKDIIRVVDSWGVYWQKS
jgi:hypothetical protein